MKADNDVLEDDSIVSSLLRDTNADDSCNIARLTGIQFPISACAGITIA